MIGWGIFGDMKKPTLILVSLLVSAVIVACGDSQPAPEVRDASPQTPAAQTPPPTKVADAKKADSKKADAKKPDVKQPEATQPDAKQPDAIATAPTEPTDAPAAAKPPKSSKKKPAAKAPEPEPAPVAEPVVVTAPASDVPPELQKYAAMAATPKFREFTALATERHTLQLRASQLRLEMRGVVATDAQLAAVAAVQKEIGKVGDRMDSYVSGKTWTQDELITMDFIVSEQMRLRPPPG